MQVCVHVIASDGAVTWCGANGNLNLNVMMPLLAHHILEAIRILSNAVTVFSEKCLAGISANVDHCNALVEHSMAMVTTLAPIIGYDRAAAIAKESAKSGKTVRQVCREWNVLPEEQLTAALDPVSMTQPGGNSSAGG